MGGSFLDVSEPKEGKEPGTGKSSRLSAAVTVKDRGCLPTAVRRDAVPTVCTCIIVHVQNEKVKSFFILMLK